jgi:hypothetical protein
VITWATPTEFELSGQRYNIGSATADDVGSASADDVLVLAKAPAVIEKFRKSYGGRDDIRHVVQLGINAGGTVAFCAQVCQPQLLLAFDESGAPAIGLERFIARAALGHVVRLRYGADPSDAAKLLETVHAEFGTHELDLVFDDASHRYIPTRTSFEALFPLVRAGGTYVIEKWAWAHYQGLAWQQDGGPLRGEPALTNLVVELAMLAGSRPDLVTEIRLDGDTVEVTRGAAVLDAPMDLGRLCRNRSNRFRPLL